MAELFSPVFSVVWLCLCNFALYFMNENSVLKRVVKRRGRALLSSNQRVQPRPLEFFAWDIIDPHSAVGGVVSVLKLLIYRIFMLLFFGFAIVFQGLWGSKFSSPTFDWLTYYTNWTFVGFGLTALLSIVITIQRLRHESSEDTRTTEWSFIHKVFVQMFMTICSSAIFLTMFYWAVLYDGSTVDLDNVMRHGINVLLMLIDLLISRVPIVTYHFQITMLYGSIYAVFMWIYFAISGDWVYSALDWDKNVAAMYYIAIPFLLILSFFITYFVALFREAVLVRSQETKDYSKAVTEEAEIEMGRVDNATESEQPL